MTIAIMGVTGSGKSTFINLLSKSNMAVNAGLRSCTSEVGISKPFVLADRQVTLIDTPGFDDTMRPSTEILETIGKFFAESYRQRSRLSGVIYMHRITDVRMSGSARRNLNMFLKLCGDTAMENVVIVTNMWNQVTLETGVAREEELKSGDFFGPLLERGARMMRHDGTFESATKIARLFCNNKPRRLRIQRELVDEQKEIFETEAGIELDRELAAMATKYKQEMDQLTKEMKDAIQERDEETRKELEEYRRDLRKKLEQLEGDRERMRRRQVVELENTNKQIEVARAELMAERARRAVKLPQEPAERQRLPSNQTERPRMLHKSPRRSKTIDSAADAPDLPSPSASLREPFQRTSEVRTQPATQSGFHHVVRSWNPFTRPPPSPSKSQIGRAHV